MAALVRVCQLGSQSLWIDEVFSLRSAHLGSPLHVADLVEDVHGPLYSAILHLTGALWAPSEWTLRLPSAVFGVALVPVMAVLARSWVGREAVVPAAWITALSPFLVWYSQEARNYMLLILVTALSAVAMLRLRERPSPGRGAAWLAAAWAGLLSNFSFALVLPLHLGWWWTAPVPPRRRLAGAALGAAALLVLTSPWILHALRIWDFQRLRPAATVATAPLRGATTFHPVAIPFALHAFTVGYSLGPGLRELRSAPPMRALARHAGEIAAVAVVFGALLLLGLAALRRRGRLAEALAWLGWPILVLTYFAARNFKVFNPRYLAVCMPAIVLVLAAAFADLRRRWAVAFALAVAALWGVSLAHHFLVPAYGKEDYRDAAALLRERGRPGERVIALGAADPVFYYYRGPLVARALWLGYAANPTRLEAKLAEALGGASGAWLVLSRAEDLDPQDAFAAWVGRRFPEAGRFGFEGVRVWHLDREAVGRLEAPAAP